MTQDTVQRQATRDRTVPAGQFLGDRIKKFKLSVHISSNDGITDRLQRDLGTLLLLLQFEFRLLAFGYIEEVAGVMGYAVAFIPCRDRIVVYPSDLSVGLEDAVIETKVGVTRVTGVELGLPDAIE